MARVVLGMLGCGTVGTGVIRLLSQHNTLHLKKVAIKDAGKQRAVTLPCPLTTDPAELVDDPEIEVLIEVMGGEEPALTLIKKAIDKRKHIVTANKEVLAKHGPELFKLSRQKGVAIFFEASVAGGVPLISTIQKGLEANKINSVVGILNGTTNFILSSMEEKGEDFQTALKKAQELGYAEADPTSDIEGYDVAYKLSILSALAFGKFAEPKTIFRQGIAAIAPQDFINAKQFGYRIKLLGRTQMNERGLNTRVQPHLVPLGHPLAAVSGANNGIVVNGDAVGELTMIGPGAGELPTASAVVGDVINLESALGLPDFASYFQAAISPSFADLADPGDWVSPHYIRLEVKDTPGVIGRIGTAFGNHQLSIRSIIQKDASQGQASVVVMTQAAPTRNMDAAIEELKQEQFLRDQAVVLPLLEATS
ncbi:MAG: homoserine dehydrogenase [Candidatus Obscuribacterales bacterium]|nr:homoserine dehydrogenase [Candidatus Obscuribacterales bacterium]